MPQGHPGSQARRACRRARLVAVSSAEVLLRAQCLRMCQGWQMPLIGVWLATFACFWVVRRSEDAMDSALMHHVHCVLRPGRWCSERTNKHKTLRATIKSVRTWQPACLANAAARRAGGPHGLHPLLRQARASRGGPCTRWAPRRCRRGARGLGV